MAGLLAIVMYYGPGRGFAAGLGDPVGCTGLGGGFISPFAYLWLLLPGSGFLGAGWACLCPNLRCF